MNPAFKLLLIVIIFLVVIIVGSNLLNSNIFSNPVTDARADAIRIEAYTQANIDRWYASQSINERIVSMNAGIQSAESMPYIALIVVCIIILVLWMSGKSFNNTNLKLHNERAIQHRNYSDYQVGDRVVINGNLFEFIENEYGELDLMYIE